MKTRTLSQKLTAFGLTIPIYVFIFLPIIWLLLSSISTQVALSATPLRWFPDQPNFKNYLDILAPTSAASQASKTFRATLQNSLFVSSSVTVISLFIGSIASYALVRIRFRFQRVVLIGILSTRMIPEISLVIPLFILASQFGLLNTPYVLIITYLSFALPFVIWLMSSFFETIPVELEESARIDGCSRLGILFRIVLPISTAGLVSTGLFVFLMAWDEFFFALIFTSTTAAKTVPVAIAEFAGRHAIDIPGMMSGGVLAALPPVILALLFQRYIVRGMTAGAVKG